MKKILTAGMDRAKELKERLHLTRPPRLEGKAKNAMMNPKRKRKTADIVRKHREDLREG